MVTVEGKSGSTFLGMKVRNCHNDVKQKDLRNAYVCR